ncbi:hypothetical protein PV327_006331 [Microctonus hyperodae]|uniref:Uncharacterized protein n=1 Tax=Microctonus hyperodae TaxID=165561 RepID=A0AA39KI31_MICHY|nr:hypothetical protein PV327_006331 [Microctonus hyperodae]
MSRVDLKVVMLGHEAVGKTSLLERYVNERFNESMDYQNTIATGFAAKKINVNGKQIVLGLWDTAGSERYRTLVKGCKIYLCATKCDTVGKENEPVPNLDTVKDYAKGIQSKFFVTSSKTGTNICELFEEIVKDFVPDPKNPIAIEDVVNLTQQMNKKRNCCGFLH